MLELVIRLFVNVRVSDDPAASVVVLVWISPDCVLVVTLVPAEPVMSAYSYPSTYEPLKSIIVDPDKDKVVPAVIDSVDVEVKLTIGEEIAIVVGLICIVDA